MDRSNVIYLIGETYEKGKYGVYTAVETRRKVYANITSVSASEWFEGGRNGLNPEYRMILFKHDYHGEDILEYNGIKYSIYRTYEGRNDTLEVYCEKKKGTE